MSALTANEIAVLRAIDASEYGDYLTDAVWTFTIADHVEGLSGRQISGTVSSLVQKGFIRCEDYEGSGNSDDATVEITEAGAVAYVAAVGTTRKLQA